MKHIKIFEEFTGDIANQADIIYKDNNLLIIVPKTFEATRKFSRNTSWCSNNKMGFYSHITTANLFRFHFKDGYKLRLTWDYLPWDGDYSTGTHWGQGGKKDGKLLPYLHIRPNDENKPFDFDYTKGDNRQDMVDRILSIPEEAKNKVIEYHNKHSIDKNDVLNNMYSDLHKIKIIDVIDKSNPNRDYLDDNYLEFEIKIEKDGKENIIEASYSAGKSLGFGGKPFKTNKSSNDLFLAKSSIEDNSGITHYESSGLKEYIYDKLIEWLKSNNKDFYTKIKNLKDKFGK